MLIKERRVHAAVFEGDRFRDAAHYRRGIAMIDGMLAFGPDALLRCRRATLLHALGVLRNDRRLLREAQQEFEALLREGELPEPLACELRALVARAVS